MWSVIGVPSAKRFITSFVCYKTVPYKNSMFTFYGYRLSFYICVYRASKVSFILQNLLANSFFLIIIKTTRKRENLGLKPFLENLLEER